MKIQERNKDEDKLWLCFKVDERVDPRKNKTNIRTQSDKHVSVYGSEPVKCKILQIDNSIGSDVLALVGVVAKTEKDADEMMKDYLEKRIEESQQEKCKYCACTNIHGSVITSSENPKIFKAFKVGLTGTPSSSSTSSPSSSSSAPAPEPPATTSLELLEKQVNLLMKQKQDLQDLLMKQKQEFQDATDKQRQNLGEVGSFGFQSPKVVSTTHPSDGECVPQWAQKMQEQLNGQQQLLKQVLDIVSEQAKSVGKKGGEETPAVKGAGVGVPSGLRGNEFSRCS